MSESKMATLGRAFTTRRGTKASDAATPETPKRSQTTKKQQSMANLRSKISLPVELISTTNNSYQSMPFISELNGTSMKITTTVKHTPSVSSRSSNSADESDRSPTGTSTPMTSPDTSSVEGSPTSVEPNHLSCYFGGPARQSTPSQDAPIIPQRAVSHTKRTAEALAHKRSISRISSTTKSSHHSISSRISSQKNSLSLARSSLNMFSANVEAAEAHPFGKELAQVSELAEEYSSVSDEVIILDPEEQELIDKGFFKFSAEQYVADIQGIWQDAFCNPTPKPLMTSMWI